MRTYNVAIVGATGAVGQELLGTLTRRNFPVGNYRLLASKDSVGKRILGYEDVGVVEELTAESFEDVDVAFFSAGAERSRTYAFAAVAAGAVVIDNTSAFRLDPKVPLVVPEINEDVIPDHGIIANPNCTTIVSLMALYPLHQAFGVKRVSAASYQAVSGAGAKALCEFRNQIWQHEHNVELTAEAMRYPIFDNIIPEIGGFADGGHTTEEVKLVNEGRKIMRHPTLLADITCARVPVERAHAVAMNIEFERPVPRSHAREVLRKAPGIVVVDNPGEFRYPMPLFVAGKDECEVGRIRESTIFPGGLQLVVVCDQLLKGAALNAVQIAELVVDQWQTAATQGQV